MSLFFVDFEMCFYLYVWKSEFTFGILAMQTFIFDYIIKKKASLTKVAISLAFFSNETNNTSFQVRIYVNVELCHIVVWML